MNLSHIRNASLSLALALGIVGCGTTSPQDIQSGGVPVETPPAETAPPIKYSFFEPTTEKELREGSNYGYLIAKVKSDFNELSFGICGLEVTGRFVVNGHTYYRLYKESDVLSALKKAKKIYGVVYIEPELEVRFDDVETNPINYGTPGDPLTVGNQWSLYAIKAMDAWKQYGFGPNTPIVASIDSGVRWSHEDFLKDTQDGTQNIVKHAWSFYEENGTSLINYGSLWTEPQDRISHPTITSTDGTGHGTHTIGTIAAVGNNGKGMAGVCWQVDLVSYKVSPNNSSPNTWALYGSLWHLANWKKENYPHTIPVNMSISGILASFFAIDMVQYAQDNGIVIVASAGNSGQNMVAFPGSYEGVIRVGGINATDKRMHISNYGRDLSVVAPGLNIVSTLSNAYGATGSNDMYYTATGTSMAAPHVTGLIAYMLTFNPDLTLGQIKTYIERNADKIDGATGFTEEYGHGRINVLNTIQAVINDINSGKEPDSDYVPSKVKITVINDNGESRTPQNNLNVHLYNCDEDGNIVNYVASTLTGASYIGSSEAGTAYFTMLKPGRYVAKVMEATAEDIYGNIVNGFASTPIFEVGQGQEVEDVEIVFNRREMVIQTFETWGTFYGPLKTGQPPDVILSIYDRVDGEPILYAVADFVSLYHFTLLPDPGTYWVHIKNAVAPWGWNGGEYGMYFGLGNLWPAGFGNNPGSYWLPETLPPYAVRGSQTHTKTESSQLIQMGDVVYGYLDDDGFWTNPPRNPLGNGMTGDYYRIVVPE
jgi:subtilisin family serine protease